MQASRDDNRITTLLAVSSVDLTTPVTLIADPITHLLQTSGSGGGGGSTNITGWFSATTPTVGQKTMSASIPVVISSDQTNLPVSVTFPASLDVNLIQYGGVATTLGQKTMTASQPVVIASDQSALTINLPTGASTSALQTSGNASLTSIDTKLTSPLSVAQSGTWNVTNITGAVSLPTGASTSALQTTGNASLVSIDSKLTSPLTIQATNLDIRDLVFATDKVDASGTVLGAGTNNIGDVDVVSSVLPTGASTEATLSAINTKLASGTVIGDVNAIQSGTWNINNISGTVSLPTGASTSALQTTGNTTLSTISGQLPTALVGARLDTNIGAWLGSTTPTVGQKTMADSVPVVLASDQTVIPASQSGTWTVQQGNTPTALATAWKVQVTDLVNTMPTMDVVARKGFVSITDGTNTMPTGDVVTRAIFQKITDGTNTTAVKASTTNPVVADPAMVVTLSPNVSTVATAIAKAEDGGHVSGDVGVMSLGVRNDSATVITSTDLDYSPISTDSRGQILTTGYNIADTNNTTTTTIAGGGSFTGTATDISKFRQLNITSKAVNTTTYASLYIEFSPDGTNWDVSIPNLIRNQSLVIPFPVIAVGKFFRLRYLNDGGVAAIASLGLSVTATGTATTGTFSLQSILLPFATTGLARTLDQSISNGDPITLTRAVISGLTPNGAYGDSAVSGVLNSNTTTTQLGAGATFTGTYASTVEFAGISISLISDQNGSLNFDWSSDGTTTIDSDTYSVFANTPLPIFLPMRNAYFRLRFTNNGGVATTTLNIQTIFKNPPASATYSTVNNPVNINDLTQKVVAIPIDGVRNSYSASVSNLDTAATPTDIFTITGSATKTIRITYIEISGDSTSNDRVNFDLIRRSTANTGGTSTIRTNVSHDSTNPAGTATVRSYTANPTLGTTVGTIRSAVLLIPSTAGNVPTSFSWSFGNRAAQAIVLRGTSEVLAINLGGAAVGATTALSISLEWVEE